MSDSYQARRERFIAAALAGFCANPNEECSTWTVETTARMAVQQADAVMAHIKKDSEPEKP